MGARAHSGTHKGGMSPAHLAKLQADTKSTMVVATVLSLIGGAAWKFGYGDPVKRNRDAFYNSIGTVQ